jgi:multidrug efflux system membrane fusion protein
MTDDRNTAKVEESTMTGKRRLGSVLCLLLSVFCLMVSCSRRAPQQRQAGPQAAQQQAVPVVVSTAKKKTLPVQLATVGTVQAYSTVSIKSQVDGPIITVHFADGQYVKTGDLLFSIDPRPFEATLNQAQANLARDRAQLENAQRQLERNISVVEKGYVSREQYDQAVASVATFKAAIAGDSAAIETAKLQLQYCSIHSPIGGRTGAVQTNAGNLVKANDTNAMAVVNQIQPIYVAFYVPQRYLMEVRDRMAAGKVEVAATIPDYAGGPTRGELTFLDNSISTSTGMIQLRGTFANEDRDLWPGQFVHVVMTLSEQHNAIVVPSQAVQAGQQGEYVFVVRDDMTVESRPVTSSPGAGNELVIDKGLKAGERVVTDGQLRLTSGTHVRMVPSLGGQGEPAP